MADRMVWQEHISLEAMADGTLTLYSDKVPPGYIACVDRMSCRGNVGAAQEYTFLGIEVNGVKFYFRNTRLQYADEVTFIDGPCHLKESDRVFAEFEAANDGEVLHLYVIGCMERC